MKHFPKQAFGPIRVLVPVFLLVAFGVPTLAAQETAADSGFDIDSLFDAQPADSENTAETPPPAAPATEETELNLLSQIILSRGFSIEANYNLQGFLAPGWTEAPWWVDEFDNATYYSMPGLQMSADLALDIQLSEVLRVQQSIEFEILDPEVKLKEFFFDYNINQKIFIRAGQFDLNWGQSHNFQFTNLLARIPQNYEESTSDVFSPKYIKIDVPVGIGGFEGVFSGRFVDDFSKVSAKNIGYGLKYNIIRPRVDMDVGVFYHLLMPIRGFFSLQTTVLKSTELYTEALVSVPHDNILTGDTQSKSVTFNEVQFGDVSLSATLGVLQSFFNDNLVLNGEVFYSGEKDASALDKDEIDILSNDQKVVGILQGLNTALNIRFQPGWKGNLGFGLSFRWAFNDYSGQIIPAIYWTPAKHVTMSIAVPMALGNRLDENGKKTYYYTHNPDNSHRPFSVIFAVSLSSNYRFGYYE
ncbi:MAG: hypothetical protein LBK61_01250 [Spirochaetaceae bacterium]|jgi:hypothetical protein|nr:hypothetical protein [Spirochaetaceae bacterium]